MTGGTQYSKLEDGERIRARHQDRVTGLLWGHTPQGHTCGCINLEPFEADGNKATDQSENQQGKQAANFYSQ